jgi:pyrroline-5-carboxylate reductase
MTTMMKKTQTGQKEEEGILRRLSKPANAKRDFKYGLGFIGGGMMCEALVKGMISSKFVPDPTTIVVSDVDEERLKVFSAMGVMTTLSNKEVVTNSRRIILGVKPLHVKAVLEETKDAFVDEQLLISICAGITLGTLESSLKPGSHVIRVMPNIAMTVQAAATCYAVGQHADQIDADTCQAIFAYLGLAFPIKEHLMDAVTGLSGSGPAYVFMMIESMSDGGVKAGISRDVSMKLAAQTVLGAAKMVLDLQQHPGTLKNRVESPGGTTITGTSALENGGFRACVINAVEKATEKSKSLGEANRKGKL